MHVVVSFVLQCELFILTPVRSLGSIELFWTVVTVQILEYREWKMVFIRSTPRWLRLFYGRRASNTGPSSN